MTVASDSVTQVMFATLSGQPDPLITRWTYRADDPFAVQLAVQTPRGRWMDWLLSRELLVNGLCGAAGDGDIRVSWQHMGGQEMLRLEIRMADGLALLAVDRELVRRFVDATAELVPLGAESSRIDLDAEIAKLTQRCAG